MATKTIRREARAETEIRDAATPTEAEITAAVTFWRRHAPNPDKTLLDASATAE